MVKHSVLDAHDVIGWDIDETLLNGIHSEFWRSWVLHNPQKTHWIITFRDKKDAHNVWEELESCSTPLSRDKFQGLLYMPDNVRLPCDSLPLHLRTVSIDEEPCLKTRRALEIHKLEWPIVVNIRKKAMEWKALACTDVGCTVLVDDLEHVVSEHCSKLGVEFVNSLGG